MTREEAIELLETAAFRSVDRWNDGTKAHVRKMISEYREAFAYLGVHPAELPFLNKIDRQYGNEDYTPPGDLIIVGQTAATSSDVTISCEDSFHSVMAHEGNAVTTLVPL